MESMTVFLYHATRDAVALWLPTVALWLPTTALWLLIAASGFAIALFPKEWYQRDDFHFTIGTHRCEGSYALFALHFWSTVAMMTLAKMTFLYHRLYALEEFAGRSGALVAVIVMQYVLRVWIKCCTPGSCPRVEAFLRRYMMSCASKLFLADEPEETRTLGDIASVDITSGSRALSGPFQARHDLPAIMRRLRQGADPNDPAEFDRRPHVMNNPALWWAAKQGHVQVAEALADAGADLGWKN